MHRGTLKKAEQTKLNDQVTCKLQGPTGVSLHWSGVFLANQTDQTGIWPSTEIQDPPRIFVSLQYVG